MSCYGYTDEQQCQFKTDGEDFCPCHKVMYAMSLTLQKPHDFFKEPKMYKLEYRYKLKYVTSYLYFASMYHMEKHIEKKLGRFKNFFQAVLIQRCFKRAMSDPRYIMCRNRLRKEFFSLQEGNGKRET